MICSKTSTPEDLQSGKLSEQLNKLVKKASTQLTPGESLTSRALQLGTTALLSRVLQNVDVSDVDVEKIGGQLRTFATSLLHPTDESNGHSNGKSNGHTNGKSAKPFSIIQGDLENYLLFSPPWKLNRETVKQEFRDVIYDAAANPRLIRQELEQIDRDYFVQELSLRNDFTPEARQDLASYLEEIRTEVFSTVQTAEEQGKRQDLRNRVENYLRSTRKAKLNPEAISQDFKTLLEDSEADLDTLGERLGQFDRSTLENILSQRDDISGEEASQIVNQLEGNRDQVLSQAKELQDRIQAQGKELHQKLSDYLRNTNKEELNPEGIQGEIKILFEDPEAGLIALRKWLSQFDRDTLVQLLSQRQDLSEEQVNEVLDQIESVRNNILHAPSTLADKAKEQYEQTI